MVRRWRVIPFEGLTGLERLRRPWTALVSTLPDCSAHHTFEAHRAYLRNLSASPDEFTCFALSDQDGIRAIAPLEPQFVTILGRRCRVWGLPGDPHDMLRDVVCPSGEAEGVFFPVLVQHLHRRPQGPAWLVLDRVLERSGVRRCLSALPEWMYCVDEAGVSNVLCCSRPLSEVMSGLSKNFRSNLRKAHNKLAALDGVRYESFIHSGAIDEAFVNFLDVEASGWKGEAGSRTALRCRPEQLAFFRDLLRIAAEYCWCEINSLVADGRTIASQFCLRTSEEVSILKIGYDERYARVAPGQLLLLRTLERCCEEPSTKRVSLLSDTPWHRDWRTHRVPVHCAYVGLGRFRGPLFVQLLAMRFKYGPSIKEWLRTARLYPSSKPAAGSPQARGPH